MAFTYFFRDQQTLDLIAQYVIPTLKQHTYIHIWDAGCAMGPEPYSLAMILREMMGPFMFRNVRIHATDIDESGEFGEVIARGVYAARGIQRVPPELLARHFTRLGGDTGDAQYQISAEMRRVIHFQRHDLLSLTPIREGLGLIVCKNVLLHLESAARAAVVQMFHGALAADGYLVTEQTQPLPEGTEPLFEQVTGAGQVFRKKQGWKSESGKQTLESQKLVAAPAARLPISDPLLPPADLQLTLDAAFSAVSQYTWLNLERGGERVGKARLQIAGERVIIHSLVVYPEFQERGYARQTVRAFQATYRDLVADAVRPEARGFWERLGFVSDGQGNYIWRQ